MMMDSSASLANVGTMISSNINMNWRKTYDSDIRTLQMKLTRNQLRETFYFRMLMTQADLQGAQESAAQDLTAQKDTGRGFVLSSLSSPVIDPQPVIESEQISFDAQQIIQDFATKPVLVDANRVVSKEFLRQIVKKICYRVNRWSNLRVRKMHFDASITGRTDKDRAICNQTVLRGAILHCKRCLEPIPIGTDSSRVSDHLKQRCRVGFLSKKHTTKDGFQRIKAFRQRYATFRTFFKKSLADFHPGFFDCCEDALVILKRSMYSLDQETVPNEEEMLHRLCSQVSKLGIPTNHDVDFKTVQQLSRVNDSNSNATNVVKNERIQTSSQEESLQKKQSWCGDQNRRFVDFIDINDLESDPDEKVLYPSEDPLDILHPQDYEGCYREWISVLETDCPKEMVEESSKRSFCSICKLELCTDSIGNSNGEDICKPRGEYACVCKNHTSILIKDSTHLKSEVNAGGSAATNPTAKSKPPLDYASSADTVTARDLNQVSILPMNRVISSSSISESNFDEIMRHISSCSAEHCDRFSGLCVKLSHFFVDFAWASHNPKAITSEACRALLDFYEYHFAHCKDAACCIPLCQKMQV